MLTERISVVIPVHNAHKYIIERLQQIQEAVLLFASEYELIAVNYGSTDETMAMINRAAETEIHIVPIDSFPGAGKGDALRIGTLAATGAYIAYCELSFGVHPRQLIHFISTMQNTGCDAVIGSKLHPQSRGNCPWHRKIVSYGYWLVLKILFGMNVKDAQTGLKLFRADAIKPITRYMLVKQYAYDIEALAIFTRQHKKIETVPIEYQYNDAPEYQPHLSDVWKLCLDTLAIFYRLKVLHFYDRAGANCAQEIPVKPMCFFVGTEAEFIKVFPVMAELEKRGQRYYLISSGQNSIADSRIFRALQRQHVDAQLYDPNAIRKNVIGLLSFFLHAFCRGLKVLPKVLPEGIRNDGYMIVHGDTVSTLMGAMLGKSMGMTVVHIEAGLRSFNLWNPFPEEIDRILTSRRTRIHFAPGIDAERNLWNAKGAVFNTQYNTLLDALAISNSFTTENILVQHILSQRNPYFVIVAHRQENLASQSIISRIVEETLAVAQSIRCVFIMHEPTKVAMERYHLLDKLADEPNVQMIPRIAYFDFMKLLQGAEFIITDGGSNQEELSYMGKPCLLLRSRTERFEGLGSNAVAFGGDFSRIAWFAAHYQQYRRPAVSIPYSPSQMIADVLVNGKPCPTVLSATDAVDEGIAG